MVGGFVATLIGLERAVALRRNWAYAAPLSSGLGALLLFAGLPWNLAHGLMLVGGVVLVAIFALFYRRQPELFVGAMGLASVWLVVGYLLWQKGEPLYEGRALPWWVGFLTLTIAAERLELTRIVKGRPGRRQVFIVAAVVLALGLLLSLVEKQWGVRVVGIGLVLFSLWLLRYDIVWRNARIAGLSRYMAIALIVGYVWLAVGGALWMFFPDHFLPGPIYDAMLHSIFLGFIFSMIVGHAPIILPAVLGIELPFRTRFYSHLGLLHLSLLLRIGGGLSDWIWLQRWGGILNVVAILLFAVNSVSAARRAPPKSPAN
jgi:hypothetical protein